MRQPYAVITLTVDSKKSLDVMVDSLPRDNDAGVIDFGVRFLETTQKQTYNGSGTPTKKSQRSYGADSACRKLADNFSQGDRITTKAAKEFYSSIGLAQNSATAALSLLKSEGILDRTDEKGVYVKL